MNPAIHALLCCALLLLTPQELAEACSCATSHPQMLFCNSEFVIRARVIGEKTIPSTNTFGATIQYEIKLIKIFKGYENVTDINFVYTSAESSLCGITLYKKEYLLAGSYYANRVRIHICGLNVLWSSLSPFQIKSFTQPDVGYQRGCACKIKICGMETYDNLAPNECPCIGRQQSQILDREHACIKRRDGTCSWYPSIPDKSIYSHP
ncbi:metalloproteinase inhibitor 4 [Anomaloglossus baeobatrachus]|uniref:metalloproteinase inhibitor 4 n=1 Tax=Anomaloglossus baeobatrachus TaxID=238106 RepID=UPI003F509CA0